MLDVVFVLVTLTFFSAVLALGRGLDRVGADSTETAPTGGRPPATDGRLQEDRATPR